MWRREGIPLYTLHFTERNTDIDQTVRYQGTKSRLLAHDHSSGIESNQQPKSKRTKTTRVQYKQSKAMKQSYGAHVLNFDTSPLKCYEIVISMIFAGEKNP
jgi:hypothetical protein